MKKTKRTSNLKIGICWLIGLVMGVGLHALSLMLRGHYWEEIIEGNQVILKKIEKSRHIPKNYIHKITLSSPNAMSITFEGPWESSWSEYFDNGRVKTYGWGRKVLFDSHRLNRTVKN